MAEKSREDYIVTNRICVDKFNAIVANDFMFLNTKYPLITGITTEINHSIVSQTTQGIFFNGWDVGFGRVSLK